MLMMCRGSSMNAIVARSRDEVDDARRNPVVERQAVVGVMPHQGGKRLGDEVHVGIGGQHAPADSRRRQMAEVLALAPDDAPFERGGELGVAQPLAGEADEESSVGPTEAV